ncbi:MAG: replication-associated recombination protein A [Gemmatimonadales bacterium]
MSDPGLFEAPGPLADRMRPESLAEVVGQGGLLAPGRALGDAIRRGDLGNAIFWGPPGVGKTTLARLVAKHTDRAFVAFSAVTEGVPRVREIIKEAEDRRRLGRGTVLFCDEIHRFNRAQQDAFLPHVERGTIALIGATTENPSFSLNGALLSRCRVFVLEPLEDGALVELLERALIEADRGLGRLGVTADPEALAAIAGRSDGDARHALTLLEAAAQHVGPKGRIEAETLEAVLARRMPRYDRAGEEHFNLLSAFHMSLRGSVPDGALSWRARMLEGGEDPRVLIRRAIAMAAEDVGLADPNALLMATAALRAYEMLGPPEGYLPLTEMVIYLATAPKSNSTVRALHAALELARETPAAPVPSHLRNAPTRLMKELGYGASYRYAHDHPGHVAAQTHLPDDLVGRQLYQPGAIGFEKKVAERLAWIRERLAGDAGDAKGGESSQGQ